MFSSVLNFFKKTKEETSKDNEKPKEENKTVEESMDELVKASTSDESISKYVIKEEESAWFVSINETNLRKIVVESFRDCQDLINMEEDKRLELFLEKLKDWKYSQLKDDFRPTYASKFGGIENQSKESTSIIRSIGVDLLKQIGKKLMAGDFNLTTISVHIRVMQPYTILQGIAKSVFQFPVYLNLASMTTDPLERFKLAVVATLSGFHKSSSFIKPLNPILGETYELDYEDGSKVYMEQTSHHPPVSHFYLKGPKNLFKYYGYSNYATGGGMNSMKVYNKGKRTVEFQDGTKITFNHCNEAYNCAFVGVMRHESYGDTIFTDEKNGFELILKISANLKKPTDHFQGDITLNKICLSKASGSYLENIEFDGIRYWDIRENIDIKGIEIENQLPSSSYFRSDRLLLFDGKVEAAQLEKEVLENVQRKDRKLRQQFSGTKH